MSFGETSSPDASEPPALHIEAYGELEEKGEADFPGGQCGGTTEERSSPNTSRAVRVGLAREWTSLSHLHTVSALCPSEKLQALPSWALSFIGSGPLKMGHHGAAVSPYHPLTIPQEALTPEVVCHRNRDSVVQTCSLMTLELTSRALRKELYCDQALLRPFEKRIL